MNLNFLNNKNFWGWTMAGVGAMTIPLLQIGINDTKTERAKSNYEWNKITPLIRKVVSTSAGKDGIWSDEEKRSFLNDLGYLEVILQSGQQIYFRRKDVEYEDASYLDRRVPGTEAEIVLGNNLKNNGGFLRGSSAKSGTVIGTLDSKKLQNYLSTRKP